MSETTVVHMREGYDVRIDRRTVYGNPFIIEEYGNRDVVIEEHMALWRGYLAMPQKRDAALSMLRDLKGKRLGCHCKPLPCHGDNYVKLIAEFCP